jgi:hypothetical protein
MQLCQAEVPAILPLHRATYLRPLRPRVALLKLLHNGLEGLPAAKQIRALPLGRQDAEATGYATAELGLEQTPEPLALAINLAEACPFLRSLRSLLDLGAQLLHLSPQRR